MDECPDKDHQCHFLHEYCKSIGPETMRGAYGYQCSCWLMHADDEMVARCASVKHLWAPQMHADNLAALPRKE